MSRTPNLRTSLRWLGAIALLAACSDTSPAEADTDRRPSDVAAQDTADDAAPVEDVEDTATPSCTPGARECVDEATARLCGDDGQWERFACGVNETCDGVACAVVDTGCEPGARACVTASSRELCGDDRTWGYLEPCPDDERCVASGQCVPRDCADLAGRSSYLGCDFLAVSLPNLAFQPGGTLDAPVAVVVANAQSNRPVNVSVTNPDGTPTTLTGESTVAVPVSALGESPATVYSELRNAQGDVVESGITDGSNVEIPAGGMAVLLFDVPMSPTQTVVQADAWRVRAEAPVVAYQFSPYCCNYSFTNDASLLLPTTALGTDYIYLGAPTFGNSDDGSGSSSLMAVMTIVGAVDDSRITIDLPAGLDVQLPLDGAVRRVDDRLYVTLDAQESLHLRTGPAQRLSGTSQLIGPDMTGAYIHANNPISVFSGHECTFVPQDRDACDHLEEQLFPVDAWGDAYVLTPTALRNPGSSETTYWKVVGTAAVTNITLSTPFATLDSQSPAFPGETDCRTLLSDDSTISLPRGTTCAFGSRTPVRLSSDSPFSVMGAISGQASTGQLLGANAGDPSIFLVAPERQFRTFYPMITPSTYAADWMTIVTRAGNPITIDEEPVSLDDAEPVPGTDWLLVHVSVEDGSHKVRGGQPFGLLSYAYDDYVSYAYTGGLDLEKR